MPIRHTLSDSGIPVQVYTDDLDDAGRMQLLPIARLPIVHHHVAAMPDVHKGIGATVGSVIVRPHGAGRRMSRSRARRELDVEALRRQTRGVECRGLKGVLDESPGACKDIDAVMANQTDQGDIVYRLKQVVCVKG